MAWHDEGHEPDYRFSLANERTILAWTRTALALLAGGVLLHEFASRIGPQWLLGALSVALVVASITVSAGAFLHWRANQIAMRHGRGLPRPHLIGVLAAFICVLSIVTAGALAWDRTALALATHAARVVRSGLQAHSDALLSAGVALVGVAVALAGVGLVRRRQLASAWPGAPVPALIGLTPAAAVLAGACGVWGLWLH